MLTGIGPLWLWSPRRKRRGTGALQGRQRAAQRGGSACAVMNGANEAAVAKFLRDEIGFYDIPRLVRRAMESVPFVPSPDLNEILEADRAARATVERFA